MEVRPDEKGYTLNATIPPALTLASLHDPLAADLDPVPVPSQHNLSVFYRTKIEITYGWEFPAARIVGFRSWSSRHQCGRPTSVRPIASLGSLAATRRRHPQRE